MEITGMISEGVNTMLQSHLYLGFLALVAFDYITGVLKSIVWKVSDSSTGLKGLIKHSTVLLGISAVWIFANDFSFEGFAWILTSLYAFNYAISILENFAVMGIYQPKFLRTKIESEIRRYEDQLENGLTNRDLETNSKKVTVMIDGKSVAPQPQSEELAETEASTEEVVDEPIEEVQNFHLPEIEE